MLKLSDLTAPGWRKGAEGGGHILLVEGWRTEVSVPATTVHLRFSDSAL